MRHGKGLGKRDIDAQSFLGAYLVIFERVTILLSMSNILYLRNFHFEIPRQFLIVNIYHG